MEKNEEEIAESLLSFGLSKKEARVYVATLSLGRGTVSQISRKAGINRTTGYDILDSLVSLGLVRASGKEPKQEYGAEPVDKLLVMLEKRRTDTEQAIKKAKDFVPQLASVHRVSDRPQVKFYEGIEGMKQVYEDTLTATEPIYAYANYEDMHATLGDYFPSYYERRAKKGVRAVGIVPATPLALLRKSKDREEARELTVVPPHTFNISPDIEIYNGKTVIVSWKEKLGIIIESAEIAEAMKNIFKLAQGEAKRLEVEAGLGETRKSSV